MDMRIFQIFILASSLLLSVVGKAQESHPLMRRLAVFPLLTPVKYKAIAEDTWWDLRKFLTEDQRFLVASKNFLQQKDVYQARGELKPADAIILGQLLEANAVVTTFLNDSELHMAVYEAEYGRLLWTKKLQLQQSLPTSSQIKKASLRLARDFVSAIPYQGFVVKDSLKKSTVYQDEGRQYVKTQIGVGANIEVGDKIQFVRVKATSLKPMFLDGATVEVFAEGQVERVDRSEVTVQLLRATSLQDIRPKSLVRIPKEFKRLQQEFALKNDLNKKIDSAYFSPEMTELDQEIQENKPLITSLSFLGNIGLFLLLAF
ncbi:MAG: hypothetical protein HRT45_17615 [Bdellovibrionales bacterium]|nr:hypothetical protein [Bdellovibrionales bacterium]